MSRTKSGGGKITLAAVVSFVSLPAFFRRIQHGDVNAFSAGCLGRGVITCIDVARDPQTRIVRQNTIESHRGLGCAVGHTDLSSMKGVADANSASVMKRDPTR